MQRAWWVFGLLSVGVIVTGCDDGAGNTNDLGPTAPVCTAAAKACLSDRVARVCAPDGKAWVPVQCRAGELCAGGECAADPNPACTSADDACMSATVALHCSTMRKGFDVVQCPTGTSCTDKGLCKGSCVVGSSVCNADGSLATCADGKSFTSVACAADQRCVSVASVPFPLAACKAAECTPSTDGCDFVCGNRANAQALAQETYLSFCQETTEGYKWVAIQCGAGKTCSPSAASCGTAGRQADCASDCTPGDTRCTTLGGGAGGSSGIQTCGPDGRWAATVAACNPNPANGGKVCFGKSGDRAHVVCGDAACQLDSGACDGTGKFHACDGNGLVVTEGSSCATGVCVQNGSVQGAWQPGRCIAQCATGEEQCLGGASFRACAAGGVWGGVQNCNANLDCIGYTTPAGLSAKACGDCVPGSTRCANDMGNGAGYVQTCAADATWGAVAPCTVGSCMNAPWGNEAVCVAECFPAKELCLGNDTNLAGLPYAGTDAHGVCTADGKIPTAVPCGADTMCRKNAGGNALGCVACVGGQNEFGMADTRCADAVGAPGSSHVQTCLPSSSGWQGIATLLACTNSSCQDASTNIPIAPSGRYCHAAFFTNNGEPATESYLQQNYGFTCAILQGDVAVPCALRNGGSVPDCCSQFCSSDPTPLPASCVD